LGYSYYFFILRLLVLFFAFFFIKKEEGLIFLSSIDRFNTICFSDFFSKNLIVFLFFLYFALFFIYLDLNSG